MTKGKSEWKVVSECVRVWNCLCMYTSVGLPGRRKYEECTKEIDLMGTVEGCINEHLRRRDIFKRT